MKLLNMLLECDVIRYLNVEKKQYKESDISEILIYHKPGVLDVALFLN